MTESLDPIPSVAGRQKMPSAVFNVLANWGGFLCSSAISLLLSPFVVHHLGNSGYGIWVLIGSVTGYLGLLNLGVRAAVMRYVARFHLEGDDQEASAIVSSALVIFLTAGIVAMLASLALATAVVQLFHVPEIYRDVSRAVVILAGSTIAVSLVSAVFGGIVAALHRFDLMNLIEVANSVLSALTIVMVLSTGKGLIGLAVVNFIYAILNGIAYAALARRIYPGLTIRIASCDRQHSRLILAFGVHSLLLQISFNLIFYTDSLIIGAFLSINAIAFFAIAANLMNYARMLISGISSMMTSRASALEAKSGRPGVRQLLMKATRFATLAILPITVTFILRGSSFIRLWMGHEYGQASGHVLIILSLALVFVAANQVAISTMMGIGRQKSVVLVVCGEALFNLALSIVLVRRWGILGVAWGTTIASLAVSFLFWPWYVGSTLDITMRQYVTSTWLRPIIAVVPFGILTLCVERLWPVQNVPAFFFQVAITLPVAAIAFWFACFDRSERDEYAQQYGKFMLWSARS